MKKLIIFLIVVFFVVFASANEPETTEKSETKKETKFQQLNDNDYYKLTDAKKREYLQKAAEEKDFTKGADKKRAQEYIKKLNFEKLSEKDEKLVDKYVQQDPENLDVSKKYFEKISDGKIKLTSGKGLSWDGKKLRGKTGGYIEPDKIGPLVDNIKEVDGKFEINLKEPIIGEPGKNRETKITLIRGSLDGAIGAGEQSGLFNRAKHASFIVEGDDVVIDGVEFHPDGGKIEHLFGSGRGYRITDNDLNDGDPATIRIPAAQTGGNADMQVKARGQETQLLFAGTHALAITAKNAHSSSKGNSILIDGNNVDVKGNARLEFFSSGNEKPYLAMERKNEKLLHDRRVGSGERKIDSGMTISHYRNGRMRKYDLETGKVQIAGKTVPVRQPTVQSTRIANRPPGDEGRPPMEDYAIASPEDPCAKVRCPAHMGCVLGKCELKTCGEMNGVDCGSKKCSGPIINAIDGKSCIGSCLDNQRTQQPNQPTTKKQGPKSKSYTSTRSIKPPQTQPSVEPAQPKDEPAKPRIEPVQPPITPPVQQVDNSQQYYNELLQRGREDMRKKGKYPQGHVVQWSKMSPGLQQQLVAGTIANIHTGGGIITKNFERMQKSNDPRLTQFINTYNNGVGIDKGEWEFTSQGFGAWYYYNAHKTNAKQISIMKTGNKIVINGNGPNSFMIDGRFESFIRDLVGA